MSISWRKHTPIRVYKQVNTAGAKFNLKIIIYIFDSHIKGHKIRWLGLHKTVNYIQVKQHKQGQAKT